MLKLAYSYKEKLQNEWQRVVFDPKFQFYNADACWNYTIDVADNSWDKIQMVSVDSGEKVQGYLTAYINRASNIVSGLAVINFNDVNVRFALDLHQFITDLFSKHQFRKIEWFVVVGNPAEKMYDKFISKHGGRIVGIKKESTRTSDGVLRDIKEYEIFERDYMNRTGGRGIIR